MITVRAAQPGDGPDLLRMTQELSKTHFPMSDDVVAENLYTIDVGFDDDALIVAL